MSVKNIIIFERASMESLFKDSVEHRKQFENPLTRQPIKLPEIMNPSPKAIELARKKMEEVEDFKKRAMIEIMKANPSSTSKLR
jgi:hypothetical protein